MPESDNVPPDSGAPEAAERDDSGPVSPTPTAPPASSPAEPVPPTEQAEQVEPIEPAVSSEPTEPAEPEEVTEPAEPAAATEPVAPIEPVVPADATPPEAAAGGLTWIPFAAYMGLWLGLAASSAWLLSGATAERPARWMNVYEPLVWAGLVLVALGPVLSLVVWLFARARRPRGARTGLFASAMIRGAATAFLGALIWIGTLYALEIKASQGGW